MKKVILWTLMLLLSVCLLGGVSVTATAMGYTTEYVFSLDDEGYLMQRTEGALAFWEAPNVLTGQTVDGGVMTLKNEADRAVDFTLTSVMLPYDDEAALTYLDSVTLVIKQGEREVYHGPFTRIMDADRAPIVFAGVQPGESRELQFSVSCDFAYSGAVPSYESIVWTFEPTVEPLVTQPTSTPIQPPPVTDWTMIAKITAMAFGVLAVTCVAVAVVRIIRKKIKQ